MSATTTPLVRLGLIVSYNVMSLRANFRRQDILRYFDDAMIVSLQGTRCRAPDLSNYSIESFRHERWQVFSAGYGARSNSHAGCEVCVSLRKTKGAQVHSVIYATDPIIQGRFIAVRVKGPVTDALFACAYMPPPTSAPTVADRLVRYMWTVFAKTPARTQITLSMDSNAHFEPCGDIVGSLEPQVQNRNGKILVPLLQRFLLIPVNTWCAAGDTFFTSCAKFSTRVDYVCLHQNVVHSGDVPVPRVDLQAGAALQLPTAPGKRVDHQPLLQLFPFRTLYFDTPANASTGIDKDSDDIQSPHIQWDFDKIMMCIRNGSERQTFLDNLSITLKGTEELWQRVLPSYSPTVLMELLFRTIRIAAKASFQKHATTDPLAKEYKERISTALSIRRYYKSLSASLVHISSLLVRLIRSWHNLTILSKYTVVLKRLKDAEHNRVQDAYMIQLCEAAQSHRSAELYRCARNVAGVQKGARGRWRGAHMTSFPSKADLERRFHGPTKAAGWGAATVQLPDFFEDNFLQDFLQSAYPEFDSVSRDINELAVQDYWGLHHRFKKMRNGRAVPTWDIPAEMWRLVFHPEHIFSSQKVSIPAASESWLSATYLLHDCLKYPLLVPRREYCYGGVRGRRREEALAITAILQARVRAAGLQGAIKLYDESNAMPSLLQASSIDMFPNTPDKVIFAQHAHGYKTVMQASDGSVAFLLVQGCGIAQGSSTASEMFCAGHALAADDYIACTSPELLRLRSVVPGTVEDVNCCSLTFIDDLKTHFSAHDVPSLLRQVVEADKHHDECFKPHDMTQNQAKADILSQLQGVGSGLHYQSLKPNAVPMKDIEFFIPYRHQIRHTARYLGPFISYAAVTTQEIMRRCERVDGAWLDFYKFWRSRTPYKFKRLMYTSGIQSILLSGLTSSVLSQQQYRTLQRFADRKSRSLLSGRATHKEILTSADGQNYMQYTALSNTQVRLKNLLSPSMSKWWF